VAGGGGRGGVGDCVEEELLTPVERGSREMGKERDFVAVRWARFCHGRIGWTQASIRVDRFVTQYMDGSSADGQSGWVFPLVKVFLARLSGRTELDRGRLFR
jgi:hypothetical protein